MLNCDTTRQDAIVVKPRFHDRLHCQKQREIRELERQVDRFGEEAMRVDPRLALDAPLPPEEFERALQLRMPDQKAPKQEDTDPCRSLLKALGITGKKKSGSRKNVDQKKDDVRPSSALLNFERNRSARRITID